MIPSKGHIVVLTCYIPNIPQSIFIIDNSVINK